jgi:hypothetical protein
MKQLLLIVIVATCFSCNHRQQKKTPVGEEKPADFFPVGSFISGQVREVDSLGMPLIETITANHNTKTIVISAAEFKRLANEFIQSDISGAATNRFYKETSFADQSAPNVTLTYASTDKQLEVQRVDVIIRPDTLVNDKVQNIYIEKVSSKKDTSIVKKLLWNADRNFQIITTTQPPNGAPVTTHLKVSWEKQY